MCVEIRNCMKTMDRKRKRIVVIGCVLLAGLAIDGAGYRTAREPCEEWSSYANRLLAEGNAHGGIWKRAAVAVRQVMLFM